MTPGIALIIIGFIGIVAGWKNQSIVDTALGRDTRKSQGNVTAPDSASAGSGATAPAGPDNPGVSGLQPQPAGTTVIDGKPVSNWIVPYVKFARSHGWKGQVTSGYRSLAEQTQLWNNRGSNSLPVGEPGKSNHNYSTFPRGAIDVTDPEGFARALGKFVGPVPLKRDPTIGDPVHFSFTGR